MNKKFQLQKDLELERRLAVQNVIDRILEHGDSYLNKLHALNARFTSPHQYSIHKNQINHYNEQIERSGNSCLQ